MKKLLILSLLFVLLAASTLPVLAKRDVSADACGVPPTQVNKRYALAGWITSIDEDNKQVTVLVAVGNVVANPCVDQEVILSVKEDTILKYSGGAPMVFTDLYEDAPISSRGFLRSEDGVIVWNAIQITLGASLTNK